MAPDERRTVIENAVRLLRKAEEWYDGNAPTRYPNDGGMQALVAADALERLAAGSGEAGARAGEDSELLDWLDTLPCGISILADAAYPQSHGMTPKAEGFSHTRDLIRTVRKLRAARGSTTGGA